LAGLLVLLPVALTLLVLAWLFDSCTGSSGRTAW
jgi:uncharacterized membrane protein